jgi:hypothetical protein
MRNIKWDLAVAIELGIIAGAIIAFGIMVVVMLGGIGALLQEIYNHLQLYLH